MKRSAFYAVVLIAMLGSSALAQSVSIGVRAGVNYANASADSATSFSSRQGLILGGVLDVELFPPLAFQVGVQYAEKGAKVAISTPGFPTQKEATYKFNYLEFPINLKLAFGEPSFQIYAFAGATIGSLLKAVGEFPTSTGTQSRDVEGALEKTDVSLEIGGGLAIGITSNLSFVADVRRSMGLRNVDQSGQALLNAEAWKPRDLRIIGGFNLRLSSGPSPAGQ